MNKKAVSINAVLITIAVSLTGCIADIPSLPGLTTEKTGAVQLFAAIPPSAADDQITDVQVTFSLGNELTERRLFLRSTPSGYVGDIELPVGDWNVSVMYYDHHGDTIFSASGNAHVRADRPTTVQLDAFPHSGMLQVTAELSPVYTADEVDRVRLELPTNHRTTLTVSETSGTTYFGKREFPPGDHEFSIVLYLGGDSLNHRVYPGPWQRVRIEPGKTVFVEWRPETGITHIETRPFDMPPPPYDLSLDQSVPDEIRLLWHHDSPADIDFFRIYQRTGDLDHYTSVATTENFEWIIDPKLLGASPTSSFVITAVNEYGYESFRTSPVEISIR